MSVKLFERWVGYYALLTGVSGFLYAVAFIIISKTDVQTGTLLSALFLLLTGFFQSGVQVGIYSRLRHTSEGFALWTFVLGTASAFGMMIHGGYDLANGIHPPTFDITSLPSQIDPRGLLTFGAGGIAMLVIAWLIEVGKQFPKRLALLGYLSAFFLLVLYIGRLIVLTPTHPVIVFAAVANGFIVTPVWYIWLGHSLLQDKQQ